MHFEEVCEDGSYTGRLLTTPHDLTPILLSLLLNKTDLSPPTLFSNSVFPLFSALLLFYCKPPQAEYKNPPKEKTETGFNK